MTTIMLVQILPSKPNLQTGIVSMFYGCRSARTSRDYPSKAACACAVTGGRDTLPLPGAFLYFKLGCASVSIPIMDICLVKLADGIMACDRQQAAGRIGSELASLSPGLMPTRKQRKPPIAALHSPFRRLPRHISMTSAAACSRYAAVLLRAAAAMIVVNTPPRSL